MPQDSFSGKLPGVFTPDCRGTKYLAVRVTTT